MNTNIDEHRMSLKEAMAQLEQRGLKDFPKELLLSGLKAHGVEPTRYDPELYWRLEIQKELDNLIAAHERIMARTSQALGIPVAEIPLENGQIKIPEDNLLARIALLEMKVDMLLSQALDRALA